MELHKNMSGDPNAAGQPIPSPTASAGNGSAMVIKNEASASGAKPLSQMIAANRAKGPADIALANLSKTVGGANGALLAKSVKNVRKFAPY
jgi:hypothetical protein